MNFVRLKCRLHGHPVTGIRVLHRRNQHGQHPCACGPYLSIDSRITKPLRQGHCILLNVHINSMSWLLYRGSRELVCIPRVVKRHSKLLGCAAFWQSTKIHSAYQRHSDLVACACCTSGLTARRMDLPAYGRFSALTHVKTMHIKIK